MCCETKNKIAETVRELIQTKSMSKITVQDVMQRADMTRQSFYYHFQDIYDVLEWDVTQQLKRQLAYRREQPFESWCGELLNAIKDNQTFYRRIAEALGRKKIQELALPYTRPQMQRLLYGTGREEPLSDDEEIALDFASTTLIDSFLSLLMERSRIDTDDCLRRVCAVVNILQGRGVCGAVARRSMSSVAC